MTPEQIQDLIAQALRSMPTDLVELNFSTSEFLPPPALAIGDIFFKRWVSRLKWL